jgi:hypothetical protein
MSNRWIIFLAAFATTAICLPAVAALKLLPGHVPAVVAHLSPIGRLPATNRLNLAIGLPLRNQAALQLLLHQLYDPASTNFHRYLTPEQFTARFGPTEADYQAVIDFVRAQGFTVTRTHANRVLLDVNASVSDIERAFHITLRSYRHPVEPRNFFAPDTDPSVPDTLPVLDISGLSDYAPPRPMLQHRPAAAASRPALGSGPAGSLMGHDFRQAYAPGAAADGFGQMVGLFELDGYDPNDIFAYEAQAGLPNVPLQNVLIDEFSGLPGFDADEVCLDIEMAMSMATNLAAVVVFEGSGNWNDVLNTMVSSNQIKQFSSSWGFGGGPDQSTDEIFQQMAMQGQSFFQASGDGDAWTSPIWQPSESPYVTSVGGTSLTMSGFGVAYVSEQVWNSGNLGMPWGGNGETNDFWGSGGGVSTDYFIPDWQTNVNMTTNLGSTTMRNIPDVALTADNVYVTYNSGSDGIFGGTSCAAPLWAGFMALANEQLTGMDNPSAGFANPAIYTLGESSNYTSAFHDITAGNNTWSGSPNLYYAVPGYDLCTGWGTPNGVGFINSLAGPPDPLAVEPRGGFAVTGSAGGPFSGTFQTFTLNNAGDASLSWTLINSATWLTSSIRRGVLAPGAQVEVVVGLTPAANTLPVGSYAASIVFTNQTTHVSQPRLFTLQVGQSLVQDGGFESGTFCHWMLEGDTINTLAIFNGVESLFAPTFNDVHSGYYGAFLGDTQFAILTQTLPTCPGQAYLLSFWLNNPSNGPVQQFAVNWNTNASTNTLYYVLNPPVFAWTNFNFVVTATGPGTVLQFGAENDPYGFGLDDVSVTPIPRPSFTAVQETPGGLALTWLTLPNVGYLLQSKTNLLQPSWVNLGASTTAVSNSLTQVEPLVDPPAFPVPPQQFYRVVVSP